MEDIHYTDAIKMCQVVSLDTFQPSTDWFVSQLGRNPAIIAAKLVTGHTTIVSQWPHHNI